MKEKKIVGNVRHIVVAGMAGCLLFGGSMQVSAATLKDVFDEKYYADTYVDLKEAFGYDREALWNHFVTYGLNEGRTMNELIDIVKYREEYEDLQKAFGDNWNAYLNHFLTFGAKERRDSGTVYNALDYAARYEDLQEAFGENVLALWKHYQIFGESEGREARDERIVAAEREAKRAQWNQNSSGSQSSSESQDPSGSQGSSGSQNPSDSQGSSGSQNPSGSQDPSDSQNNIEYEYNTDGTVAAMIEKDGAGNVIKITEYAYNEDGTISSWLITDGEGVKIRTGHYEYNEGGMYSLAEYSIEKDGSEKLFKRTDYFADGSIYCWITYEEDNGGNSTTTIYNGNGTIASREKRDSDGKLIETEDREYIADGSICIRVYDGDRYLTTETTYNADNKITELREYRFESSWGKPRNFRTTQYTYDDDGNLKFYLIGELDSNNKTQIKYYDADGNEIDKPEEA